ncbi:MAG: YicC family protein [Acidobacteria bacterium]|nr:MAG: YicC family protein [Acidobacteriota bacterium]
MIRRRQEAQGQTMHSMTGFGQGTASDERQRITVTLRGVNHRFLDLHLRLREEHRALEPVLRQRLRQRLRRGRLEVQVEVELLAERPVDVELDERLAHALGELSSRLLSRGLIAAGPTFGDLLRLPELVRLKTEPLSWEEADLATVELATDRALDQLLEARATEGAKLAAVIEDRLDALEVLLDELTSAAAGWPAAAGEALRQRVEALLGELSVDPARLAQEVALLVDRSDVREELDRLRSHLEHFRGLMAKSGAVGKRLDFLSQEIFRELNTIGAKCRNADMTRLVLAGKGCCEQIREQVQNVE